MFSRRSLLLLPFKRLVQGHPFKTKSLLSPTSNTLQCFPTPSFKAFNISTIPTYSFSSFKNLQRTDLKEDLNLLSAAFSQEQLAYATEILKKYAECKDFSLLTDNEISWISWVLYDLSQAHLEQNNYDRAYKYLFEHENLYKKIGVKDNFDLAQNYYYRAYMSLEQNNWNEAEHYLNEVSRICQLLENDQEVRGLMVQHTYSLASLYARSGQDQEKALVLYNSVLEKVEDLREAVLPTVLMEVYQGTGLIYSSRNDIEKVLVSWSKGLEVAVKYYGENSKDAYEFYVQMAEFLYERGQYSKARQYAEKSVQVAMKTFSKDSREVVTSYLTLGQIYQKLQNDTKALNSFKKAAKILEKSPEKDPYILSETYFQMALTHAGQGNSQEASDFLAKADQVLVLANKGDPLQLGDKYFQWARDLQGLMEESKAYFWKALEAFKNCEPLEKTGILDVYAHLGMLAFGEQDWSKACEMFKESEKYFDEAIMSPNFPKTLYRLWGSACVQSKKYDEGEKYLQKALKSCQATGDSEWIGEVYHNLGIVHEKREMLKEALETYKKAVEHEKQKVERDDENIQADIERISEIEKKLKEKSEENAGKISHILKTFKNSDKKNSS